MATAITALSASPPRRQHNETLTRSREPDQKCNSTDGPNSTICDAASEEQNSIAAVAFLLSTNILKASPYAGPEHLLHLETLDTQNRLMALALTSLAPARPDYALISYQHAFDWNQVIAHLATLAKEQRIAWRKQSFYVVEFRSKLKTNIDNDRLYLLDKQSHIEATASGGLLKYWYGSPDLERCNLATCLWRCKEDAVKGGRGPWHKQARAVIPTMYEVIEIKGLNLTIEDDVQDWAFSS